MTRTRTLGPRARRLAAALGVVALVGGPSLARGAGASTGSAPRTSHPTCVMAHLHVSFYGRANGTAGTMYHTLRLLNVGPTCTMPAIVVRGYNLATHHYVGPWGTAETTSSVRVVVATGASAYVAVGVGDTANYPVALCRPATASALAVAAVGRLGSIVALRLGFTTCTIRASLHTNSPTSAPPG